MAVYFKINLRMGGKKKKKKKKSSWFPNAFGYRCIRISRHIKYAFRLS
jgi:hypothetical protein